MWKQEKYRYKKKINFKRKYEKKNRIKKIGRK